MNIQIFVSLAKRGDEVVLLGIGTNSRLVETQRDAFIMRPDNIDYESQTQIHKLEVGWKNKYHIDYEGCPMECTKEEYDREQKILNAQIGEREDDNDISKEASVSN